MSAQPNPIQKLKLELNKPQVISVKNTRGLPVTSKFAGDQVMWTLADGRKYCGHPSLQQRIDELHLQPMQPFEIEQVEMVNGNIRDREVVVRPVRKAAASATAHTQAAHTPANHIPATQPGFESELQRALKEAIEACANAELYAKSISYDCRFSPEQVKCMAISVLIGMQSRRQAA